jgi:hypothetical protein
MDIGVAVGGNRQLPDAIDALGSPGRFAGGLDGGQQEAYQNADDGD